KHPKHPKKLPVVLTRQEVARMIEMTENPVHRIILMSLYGTGLRRMELTHLKAADIDSARMVIHVRGGKGRKDRDVMRSPKWLEALRRYWRCLKHKPKPEQWLFTGGGRAHDNIEQPMIGRSCGTPLNKRPNGPASIRPFTRTRCATASPLTYWKPASI